MKQGFEVFFQTRLFSRALILAVAVFRMSVCPMVAQDVAATYVADTEVPVSSDGFIAEGKTIKLALNFAPPAGTQLTVVQNTGSGIIRGPFKNLAQGQTVTLTYSGIPYYFVANYYGGDGNDLVLLWTTGDTLVAPVAKAKLDDQLLLALRKARGEPPFDKPTSLEPAIPITDGDRVLVDIEGSVSKDLVDQIILMGGALPDSPASNTLLRAMIPLSKLEPLALRSDVKSIAPAKVSVTRRIEAQ
jgi:hypothetical protein